MYLVPCGLQDVDLYTVTPADLTFSSSFLLTASRNDYIDALVAFFTVEFTKCHKRTWITTCEYLICFFRLLSLSFSLSLSLSLSYALLSFSLYLSTKCTVFLCFACLLAPSDRYTHWKQTVFYLQDCLTIKQGEQLSGTMSVARNPRNKVL